MLNDVVGEKSEVRATVVMSSNDVVKTACVVPSASDRSVNIIIIIIIIG